MTRTASIINYPPERRFVRYGAAGTFGLHLFFAGFVALIAFLTHIKTIQQLMAEGGAVEQSGPAPEEQVEVTLRPDDLPPPPPTVNPDFVKQVELPKPVVIPPPPVPVVKRVPKPVVAKPHFTAPKATGHGESASVSHLVVGSSGFPRPGYPYEAEIEHETGTVVVSIVFDSNGNASDVEVTGSSGVGILDSTTRSFIRAHWHNPDFAGQRAIVPIEYQL